MTETIEVVNTPIIIEIVADQPTPVIDVVGGGSVVDVFSEGGASIDVIAETAVIEVSGTGVAGPEGPPGPSDSFYHRHDQILSSAGWLIEHNLGKWPNVSVVLDDETTGVAVHHLDLNTAYIPFSEPHTGTAICS